jgi:hypothetical protein
MYDKLFDSNKGTFLKKHLEENLVTNKPFYEKIQNEDLFLKLERGHEVLFLD